MMDKILWKALFCERTVSYGQALYDRNYLNIWFQEETFEAFLTSQSTDVKLDCAKKLYAALRSQESVFIPSSIIETNLHEQLHKLSPSTQTHYGQDHFLHSINLYILGIYLFFNNDILYSKVLNYFKLKVALQGNLTVSSFQTFLRSWKLFAFYHDVGYFVEANSFSESLFHSFFPWLAYEYTVKYTADQILVCALASKANANTEPIIKATACSLMTKQWEPLPGTANQAFFSVLGALHSMRCLSGMHSPALYRQFRQQGFFSKGPAVVVLYNSSSEPIAFFGFQFSNESVAFRTTDSEFSAAQIHEFLLDRAALPGVMAEYFFSQTLLDTVPADFLQAYQEAPLPDTLLELLTLENDVSDFLEKTKDWLRSSFSFSPSANSYITQLDSNRYLVSAIVNYVSKHLNDTITNLTKKVSNSSPINNKADFDNFLNQFTAGLTPDAFEAISADAGLEYNRKRGASSSYINAFRLLYEKLLKDFSEFQGTNVFRLDEMLQLASEQGTDIIKNLEETFRDLAETTRYGLYAELLKYKPDYSDYDHGLVSASFLLSASMGQYYIFEKSSQLRRQCQHIFDPEKQFISLSEAIFAIALHNIYCKKCADFGLDYTIDLEKNPFAYFSALSDVLQRWGRNKQLDYSVVKLPEDHFLEDEYSIHFRDHKIIAYYHASDYQKILNQYENYAKYMNGIRRILQIELLE